MAGPMRIKYNRKAFRQIRTSKKAQDAVKSMADDIAAAAGGDVVSEKTEAPRNRARAAAISPSGRSKDRILPNVEAGRR